MGEGEGKTQAFPCSFWAGSRQLLSAASSHQELIQNLAPVKPPGTTPAHIFSSEKDQSLTTQRTTEFFLLLQHSQAREEICVPLSDNKLLVLLLHENGEIIMPQSSKAAPLAHTHFWGGNGRMADPGPSAGTMHEHC